MSAPGLHLPAVGVLLVAAVALAVFGVRFHRRQNAGGYGGRISAPKAYWLPFALFMWFVLCPLVGLCAPIPPPLAHIFLAYAASMWLRGIAEMVMLYGTKNWRPPYGISHDAFCMVLIAAMAVRARGTFFALQGTAAVASALLLAAVFVSLALEIVHARSFFVAVQGKTTGEDGIWFADDEERFRVINQRTLVGNVLLTACVAAYLLVWPLGLAFADAGTPNTETTHGP